MYTTFLNTDAELCTSAPATQHSDTIVDELCATSKESFVETELFFQQSWFRSQEPCRNHQMPTTHPIETMMASDEQTNRRACEVLLSMLTGRRTTATRTNVFGWPVPDWRLWTLTDRGVHCCPDLTPDGRKPLICSIQSLLSTVISKSLNETTPPTSEFMGYRRQNRDWILTAGEWSSGTF